ncbi:MAG: hypothetical protein ACFFBC_00540 [Promethearchaeota archaeon]
MDNDDFKKIIEKLKLLKMLVVIKEIIKMLRFIHSERLCTPMKIRSEVNLGKSAIYNYLIICLDLKLIVRFDLPKIHEDGSHYMVMTTKKLKKFLEELDNYTKEIFT